jgi:hypothetical protein
MSEHAGRYELIGEIGAGGMGSVYRARDPGTGGVVALKQLSGKNAGDKRAMLEALFEREYHTLVRLKHPRIIEVYDYGVAERGPYYTMELLDGADLQQLAPLPYRDACRHLRDVASSLALIHGHRLLHRDVSPRNVRLTADGRAKLIDFGALTSFGTSQQIVGTPPCMAPEVLRHLPLDQRTDLYALGATAYWALTGRHAYPARRAQELFGLWESPLPPPSQFAADIPPALDALVLSLLKADPLARPASAAEVIERLTAIAGLEPEEHDEAAQSYLSSGPLVGRGDEQRWLQERIARAFEGRGTELLIEGPAGIGKTRLLQELCVQAQMRGAVTLRADALANPRGFGVAAALAVALVDAVPELARSAAGAAAPLLAHLSRELGDKLQSTAQAVLEEDPGERRARLQTALHDWFMAVASERVLLIAVDNLQAADDNSAAFLAALGREAHRAKLALVVAQRSGEAVAAPNPVRALRKHAACLKLAHLGQPACEELVGSLFGHAANAGRLAKLLFDKSGGNPQRCMDLAQLVVKRGIAKYVGGSWVLPFDVSEDELPSRFEDLVHETLDGLRPLARALCEALSVHGRQLSIERCQGLVEGGSERDVYLALDQLIAEQILVLEDGSYGFRQQAMQQAVLAQIPEPRRRQLSARAAQVLLAAGGTDVEARVEAAWHLLNAGQEQAGADLMTDAAREFLERRGVEDAEQVVRAIETAIALYEKHGRSKYEIARLLFPLMSLAFFVDWRVTLKHGERAIDLGLDITGLGLAGKLSRILPGKLALGIGLGVAFVRFAWQQLRGLKYGLVQAIEGFCGLVPAAIGTQNLVFDLAAVQRFTHKLRPLTLFGERHIAALMFDFARSQYLMSTGRENQAHEVLETLRSAFPDPATKKALGEEHWKAMYGGILFSIGIVAPYEFGRRALEMASEMETLGVRVWSMAAEEVRMLYHAFRGETEEVQRYRERVELFAVQGSTTWQAEIFWPILLLDSEIRCGHTLGVRTIFEQLTRRAKDHPSLQVYAQVAQATYTTLRGEHRAAIALYERILRQLEHEDPTMAWQGFRACFGYVHALYAAGEHERAKRFATELLARAGSEVPRIVGHYLEPQRRLALAEAALGHHERAVSLLDSLLAEHGGQDQPMLIGLLHEARAEVALIMSDAEAFERHFAAMDQRYRAAKNPSLIAQGERLAAEAVRVGLRARVDSLHPQLAARAHAVDADRRRALRELATADDPAHAALRLVARESCASRGFLYTLSGERLALAASTHGGKPPASAEERLTSELLRVQHLLLEEDSRTAALDSPPLTAGYARSVFIDNQPAADSAPRSGSLPHGHRTLALVARDGGAPAVIGGIVLLDPERPFAAHAELLDEIAAVLHGRAQREVPSIATTGRMS